MAIELGADALGLVGPMPSGAGVIDDGAAAEIARITPPPVSTFLLTSEKSADGISRHAAGVCPTALQVVSHIDPQEYRRLDASLLRARVKRIQVIHVEGEEALDLIDVYSAHVDAFLLDSGRPLAVTPELGGTGRTHDWDISAAFVRQSPLPVFLAGGLTPHNAAEAVLKVKPYGVDLCTGVRTDDALDRKKLNAFVEAVTAADRDMALL